MSIRLRPVATACLLALATSIFYGLALGRQPIGREEARVLSYAQQPQQGVPPVVINTGDGWLQPLHVYATALAHWARPGFFAGRWASVIVAAINAGLVFLVGWRVFGGYIAALAATLVLILTPAHMTYGRQGLEAIYIVPFVLLWLYALAGFIEKDRPSQIAAASAALGAGVYSTTAAPLTMAFLWLTMIVVLWAVGRRKLSTIAVAAASFVVMLVPLALWFTFHPQTYMDTYGSWAIHQAHIRNPIDGLSRRDQSQYAGDPRLGVLEPDRSLVSLFLEHRRPGAAALAGGAAVGRRDLPLCETTEGDGVDYPGGRGRGADCRSQLRTTALHRQRAGAVAFRCAAGRLRR